MRCSVLLLLSFGAIWSSTVEAQFRFEVQAAHSETDDDREQSTISGRYFFENLDTTTGPPELAAFLTRVDSAFVRYRKTEGVDAYAVGGIYNHSESGWYVSGVFGRSSGDNLDFSGATPTVTAFSIQDRDTEEVRMSVGHYILDTTTLAFNLGRSESEANQSFSINYPVLGNLTTNFISKSTSGEWGLSFMHFGRIGQYGYTVDADYSRLESDVDTFTIDGPPIINLPEPSATGYALGASIFPLDTVSVRVSYRLSDASLETETTNVRVEWFVLDQMSMTAAYEKAETDVPVFIAPVTTPPSENLTYTRPLPSTFPAFDPSSLSSLTPPSATTTVFPPPDFEKETFRIELRFRF